MPCLQNNTCDCQCTLVFVDPAGSNIAINADRGGRGTNGCHCDLAGNDGAGTTVDMWVSETLLFISVTTGGVEYHGICEGLNVCDAEGNFDCGGDITLYDEDLNTLVVTIDGRSCTSCSNGWPEILVTVFDADYANPAGLNWAGQSWTQAEVQGGVTQKIACPTTYYRRRASGSNAYGNPTLNAGHRWEASNLGLWRTYYVFFSSYNPPGKWYRVALGGGYGNWNILGVFDVDDNIFFNYSGVNTLPVPATLTNSNNAIGKISLVSEPYYTAYAITDDFFGTHTTGGVQYTWQRGGGW